MTAPEIIGRLRVLGVQVRAQGAALLVEAAAPPPAEVLALVEALKRCKLEALAHLSPWPGPCITCRETCWWLSVHGQIVCGLCHPPAYPELVRAWVPAAACRWKAT